MHDATFNRVSRLVEFDGHIRAIVDRTLIVWHLDSLGVRAAHRQGEQVSLAISHESCSLCDARERRDSEAECVTLDDRKRRRR